MPPRNLVIFSIFLVLLLPLILVIETLGVFKGGNGKVSIVSSRGETTGFSSPDRLMLKVVI